MYVPDAGITGPISALHIRFLWLVIPENSRSVPLWLCDSITVSTFFLVIGPKGAGRHRQMGLSNTINPDSVVVCLEAPRRVLIRHSVQFVLR